MRQHFQKNDLKIQFVKTIYRCNDVTTYSSHSKKKIVDYMKTWYLSKEIKNNSKNLNY